METDTHPAIEPISLTTNDGILDDTPTSPTATKKSMGVSKHDTEGPMSLSTSLFVKEERRSRLSPNNLDEGEDMPHIISVQ